MPETTANQSQLANDKQLAKLTKVLHRLGKDTTIKEIGGLISIFQYYPSAMICKNCGWVNPPDVAEREIPACLNCGLTHMVSIFVGPYEKPEAPIDDVLPNDQAIATPIELVENEQSSKAA